MNAVIESGTASFLANPSRLRTRVDRSPGEAAVLRLARAHRLSVYDAAYLELAPREALPLATLDGDLRRAASGEGVPSFPAKTRTDPRPCLLSAFIWYARINLVDLVN